MKQRLWIVTELFYPDETATAYILTNVANKLSEKYDVHVICGPISDHVPSISSLNEMIKVHRSNIFNVSKDQLLLRTLRFIFIGLVLTFKLLWYSRKSDKVLIVTNPAPLVVLVSMIKWVRKFELSILVHDVFPENAASVGLLKKSSLSYRIMKPLFDRSYAKADKLIVLGRDMAQILKNKIYQYKSQADIRVIPNWADVDLIEAKGAIEHSNVVIQYAGNIGRVQGLMEFADIFKMAQNPNVLFSIWGKGAMEKELKSFAQTFQTENIIFNGPFTRAEQNDIVQQCDICLVTLSEGMKGLGVPSKTYNIMAAGKPILYIGPKDSEIFLLVSEKGIGYCFDPSDKDGIVCFLKKLNPIKDRQELLMKGKKARELAVKEYTKEKVLDQFIKFI